MTFHSINPINGEPLWKRSPRFAGRISFRRSRSRRFAGTLHVSRKVVRKVIRSEATEFHYEREKQPLPKIGPWREQLDALLLENDGKPARERLTLIRLFEELRGFGYAGSYDAVRRYAITLAQGARRGARRRLMCR